MTAALPEKRTKLYEKSTDNSTLGKSRLGCTVREVSRWHCWQRQLTTALQEKRAELYKKSRDTSCTGTQVVLREGCLWMAVLVANAGSVAQRKKRAETVREKSADAALSAKVDRTMIVVDRTAQGEV